MIFETLTPNGMKITVPDMHGKLLCAWESGPEIGLYRDIKYRTFEIAELVKLCKE